MGFEYSVFRMNHQCTLSFNQDGTVTATCKAGDLTLTDTLDIVLLASRDHQFEKDHGVILDKI